VDVVSAWLPFLDGRGLGWVPGKFSESAHRQVATGKKDVGTLDELQSFICISKPLPSRL
jgi:hypothetical protein